VSGAVGLGVTLAKAVNLGVDLEVGLGVGLNDCAKVASNVESAVG
jgi:pantoate kinase